MTKAIERFSEIFYQTIKPSRRIAGVVGINTKVGGWVGRYLPCPHPRTRSWTRGPWRTGSPLLPKYLGNTVSLWENWNISDPYTDPGPHESAFISPHGSVFGSGPVCIRMLFASWIRIRILASYPGPHESARFRLMDPAPHCIQKEIFENKFGSNTYFGLFIRSKWVPGTYLFIFSK